MLCAGLTAAVPTPLFGRGGSDREDAVAGKLRYNGALEMDWSAMFKQSAFS